LETLIKESANFIIAAFKGEELPSAPKIPSDVPQPGPNPMNLSNLNSVIPMADWLGLFGVRSSQSENGEWVILISTIL
jgi:hypothetical protein